MLKQTKKQTNKYFLFFLFTLILVLAFSTQAKFMFSKEKTGTINTKDNRSLCTIHNITNLSNCVIQTAGNDFNNLTNAKNNIKAKPSPNFNTRATTDEGMFMMEDDGGESYYFRGTAPNNWVKFGKTGTTPNEGEDIYWRIVRINGNGSIRLIFSGIGSPQTSRDAASIGESAFNTEPNYSRYSGYSYGAHDINCTPPNCTDSTIKTYIENWFQNNLVDEEDKLEDNPFCIDKSIGERPSNWETYYNLVYGATSRVMKYTSQGPKTPQLKCPRTQDKYLKANGYLKYPIGLLTLDEASIAGGVGNPYAPNNQYYLDIGGDFWFGSPGSWNANSNLSAASGIGLGTFGSSGKYGIGGSIVFNVDFYVANEYYVRPVISISSLILYKSGDGSINNPYIADEVETEHVY